MWWFAGATWMMAVFVLPKGWLNEAVLRTIPWTANLLLVTRLLEHVFGFVVGMFVFETYVYIGVRRCRFADGPEVVISRECHSESNASDAIASPRA